MSLLGEIIDSLEFERLLNEGKDPVELLHYKFESKGVPSDVIDSVIAIDPTKKKSYSMWLLSKWDEEENTIIKNLNNGRIKKLFDHYKEHSNEIQIQNCPSVKVGLAKYVPEEETILDKSDKPKTYLVNTGEEVDSSLANDFDIVYNDGSWVIAVPNTYEASCKLGENMKWCTANGFGNGKHYYNYYLDNYGGKYFINFDMTKEQSCRGKDYPFTRYQFHFPSKQFKDCYDDDVNFEELDMPSDVYEYYDSIGFGSEYFENEEEKMERYEEQRWACSYTIFNDLYLSILYNENYEFEEPDESTDYYVFDDNDSRDPICYEEIPNPNTNNDVIIEKEEDVYVILRTKSDNYMLAVKEKRSNHYRDWESYVVKQYFRLDMIVKHVTVSKGLFCLTNDNKLLYVYDGNESILDYFIGEEVNKVFFNKSCEDRDKSEWNFIEVVYDGKFHALYSFTEGTNLVCIIEKDIPANGEYYVMEENGTIKGKYLTYNNRSKYLTDNEDEEGANYHFSEELSNGDYIVKVKSNKNRFVFNILKKDTHNLLLKEWVNGINHVKNMYAFKSILSNGGVRYYFADENGNVFGGPYNTITPLNDEVGVFVGKTHDYVELADANNCSIFFKCKSLNTYVSNSNKIIFTTFDNQMKAYDVINRKESFNSFCSIHKVYGSIFRGRKNLEDETYVLYDAETDSIIADNLQDISDDVYAVLKAKDKRIVLLKNENGMYNALNCKSKQFLLNKYVNDIIRINDYLMQYKDNDEYFIYDYENKKMLSIVECNICNVSIYSTDVHFIDATAKGAYKTTLIFSFENDSLVLKEWYYYDRNAGGFVARNNYIDENTPQTIIELYNYISSNSILESKYKLLKLTESDFHKIIIESVKKLIISELIK